MARTPHHPHCALLVVLCLLTAPEPATGHSVPGIDSLTATALRFLPPNNPIRPDSAKAWARLAVAARPSARAHAVLADAWAWEYSRTRDAAARDSARAHLDASLRVNPSDAHAEYVGGMLAGLAADTTAMLAGYERALALDPDHEMAGGNLVTVLDASGRVAEAIALGERYLRMEHRNRRMLFRYGWVLAFLWEAERAEAVFRRLVAMDPRGIYDGWGRGELACLRRAQGDAAGAVAVMREAVNARPDDGISRSGLAHMQLNAGEYREAIPRLEAELRADPAARGYGNVPSALLSGWGYLQAGDSMAARAVLEPLEARLRQAGTLQWLVPLLAMTGRPEEAASMAERLPLPRLYGSPTPNDHLLTPLLAEARYAAVVAQAQEAVNARRRSLGLPALIP